MSTGGWELPEWSPCNHKKQETNSKKPTEPKRSDPLRRRGDRQLPREQGHRAADGRPGKLFSAVVSFTRV